MSIAFLTACEDHHPLDPSSTDAASVIGTSASVGGGNNWFVKVNGTSSSLGGRNIATGWDLQYAMNGADGLIKAGDIVWITGGTYVHNPAGSFVVRVHGAPGQPVVFKQYPGHRAIIDRNGGIGASTPLSTLRVGGDNAGDADWTEFWDFEVTNSDGSRDALADTGHEYRPVGIYNEANNTRFVRLVVHDNGSGFYTEPAYTNVNIAGCIIYNNGWDANDRGHGHGLYLRSASGPLSATDNIVLNQFGYGIHLYSPNPGQLNGITLTGNVVVNSGDQSNHATSPNILLGGECEQVSGCTANAGRADNIIVRNNFVYYSPNTGTRNVQAGYPASDHPTTYNGSLDLSNNYIVGGAEPLQFRFWESASVTGNEFTPRDNGRIVSLYDDASNINWSGSRYWQPDGSAALSWWKQQTTYNSLNAWQGTGLGSGDAILGGHSPCRYKFCKACRAGTC
jgi:hypothetical protein